MTRWWWVRHGPTHQKAFTGWRDVPADLSDTARISRLSDHLPDTATVLASDLIRASDTADAIQGRRKRLTNDPALREFHFGDWDGLIFSDVAERDPALSRQYWETPGDVAPPNGESWNAAAARVIPVVDRFNADPEHSDIVAVAHFGIILTQIQRASGATAQAALAHTIDPLSVTCLTHENGVWRVEAINHSP